MRNRNWLLFLLLAFIWGANWSVMKLGLSFVTPANLLFQQYVISFVSLSPVFISLRRRIPRDKSIFSRLLVYSIIYVIQMTLMRWGLVGESSGMGAVLTYLQPLFVFCLAIPFLSEKMTTPKLLGAIIGFAGVCLLFIGKIGTLSISSSLIMISSAFLWAVATIYYKRFLQKVDPFVTNFFQLSIGAFPLALFCLVTNTFSFPMSLEYFWIILYSSVGSFAIGWSIWLFLLKQEDATTLSGSSFIIPGIALVIGWRFMEENIGLEAAFGSALILGGVYLVNFMKKQKTRRQTAISPQQK
ncbi:MAG: hypothetical protein QG670_251 [Thermoproteota archaeon]|nr:hypothetical protein [Thermoproteota archaeon]